ncbi:hypothetical protein TSUD_151640 [Trifolium subterraneum]|uniref:Uncharacterized protein n=1 Tax=Trifolium subterraneum TaxID=3900 RepID=A0A2Z6N3Z6_TRISU|nr:hypothetical protein TSUD_151640 [Trifolium subterraneum]
MENRLNQRRVSFSTPQSQKHTRDDEFVAAIAATAFSIYSLEEAGVLDLKKIRDSPKFTKNLTIRGKEENIPRQPSYGK